ncbi:MAG: hypothetical protein ACYCXZ_06530 [Coriobacteriia bacterium]
MAELVYQAFHHAKKDVPFRVVSRRSCDKPNQTYLETADGCFLITVTPVHGSDESAE